MSEWFKVSVSKTVVGEIPPWVRIPPFPPNANLHNIDKIKGECYNKNIFHKEEEKGETPEAFLSEVSDRIYLVVNS